MKLQMILVPAVAAFCVACLSGCGPRDEEVVVQQPNRVVEKETTVKPVPDKPDTVVIKQQPPATETKTETDVKVTVDQRDGQKSKQSPTPSQSKSSSSSSSPQKSANQKSASQKSSQQSKSTPTQRPTTTPVPRPQRTSANLVVRGEVMETSKVPDPKSVPYKEALVFTKYRVIEVQRGTYAEKEILVAHWGMRDRQLQPAARISKGDRHRLELVPLAGQHDLRSTMRLDDTGEFELEPYFATQSP